MKIHAFGTVTVHHKSYTELVLKDTKTRETKFQPSQFIEKLTWKEAWLSRTTTLCLRIQEWAF